MNWLRPLIREALILYYRWALAEIPPTHPDVPFVVHRLRDLRAERHNPRNIERRIVQWL